MPEVDVRNPAAVAAHINRLREGIAEHGWVLQGIFQPGEDSGFVYTIGLAPAGLPELVIDEIPHDKVWFACRALNTLVMQALVEELQPGQAYSIGGKPPQQVQVHPSSRKLLFCRLVCRVDYRVLVVEPWP